MTPEDSRRPGSPWNERDDLAIEESLWRSAKGYDVEETVEEDSEKTGRKTRVKTHHIPGDVRAQIFWLKNRRPDTWKDKPGAAGPQETGVTIINDIPE